MISLVHIYKVRGNSLEQRSQSSWPADVKWTMHLVKSKSSEDKAWRSVANDIAHEANMKQATIRSRGTKGLASIALQRPKEGWVRAQGIIGSLQAPGLPGHCWAAGFSSADVMRASIGYQVLVHLHWPPPPVHLGALPVREPDLEVVELILLVPWSSSLPLVAFSECGTCLEWVR